MGRVPRLPTQSRAVEDGLTAAAVLLGEPPPDSGQLHRRALPRVRPQRPCGEAARPRVPEARGLVGAALRGGGHTLYGAGGLVLEAVYRSRALAGTDSRPPVAR